MNHIQTKNTINGNILLELGYKESLNFFIKKINKFKIWIEKDNNEITLNEYNAHMTSKILNFYLTNKNSNKVKLSSIFKDEYYIDCLLNSKTGEILSVDEAMNIIFNNTEGSDRDKIDAYWESVYIKQPWEKLYLSIKGMDDVIKELSLLT